jgi:hypothetical protein
MLILFGPTEYNFKNIIYSYYYGPGGGGGGGGNGSLSCVPRKSFIVIAPEENVRNAPSEER